jgi:hypothetical protein
MKHRDLTNRRARQGAAKRDAGKVFVIAIPNFVPVRKNQWYGKHWRVRYRLGKEQTEIIGNYAIACGALKATGRRKVTLSVWKPGQAVDYDAFDTLLLDSLVKCELLIDDSPDGIYNRVEVIVTKSKERRTEIRLENA